MPPALLGDLLLYFCHSPTNEIMINGSTEVRTDDSAYVFGCFITSRTDSPGHPPVEGSVDFSTVQPKLDVVLFVDHRVLATREPGVSRREEE